MCIVIILPTLAFQRWRLRVRHWLHNAAQFMPSYRPTPDSDSSQDLGGSEDLESPGSADSGIDTSHSENGIGVNGCTADDRRNE